MQKTILYFDCFSGISGDMVVGALLDLGADRNLLLKGLSSLPVDGYEIEITKGARNGICGTDFNVVLDARHDQPERSHKEIRALIDASGLNANVKKTSAAIFSILAEAEAKVHGTTPDHVHFHEVGAVDSILDVVGAALCVDQLKPDVILCSPLNLGGGTVAVRHGILPVPAPATAEILKDVPVYSGPVKKELTTPTGAAIVMALCTGFGSLPSMTLARTGYGLGKMELENPNVLRAFIGKAEEPGHKVMVLETNIDNMNPEIYSYLVPKLLEMGALDVYTIPILMKKNRPANLLGILCPEPLVAAVEAWLFRETPTLGIRKHAVDRTEMERKPIQVQTPYGAVTVKVACANGQPVKVAPEYEVCREIAERTGQPLQAVMQNVQAAAAQALGIDSTSP